MWNYCSRNRQTLQKRRWYFIHGNPPSYSHKENAKGNSLLKLICHLLSDLYILWKNVFQFKNFFCSHLLLYLFILCNNIFHCRNIRLGIVINALEINEHSTTPCCKQMRLQIDRNATQTKYGNDMGVIFTVLSRLCKVSRCNNKIYNNGVFIYVTWVFRLLFGIIIIYH